MVGPDRERTASLMWAFVRQARAKGLNPINSIHDRVEVDGSIIWFITATHAEQWMKQHRIGVGEFWDNSCAHWQGPFWELSACTVTKLIKEPMRDWRI